MCELLGISCNKETNISLSFKVLQSHGNANPDGWGIGFYNKGSVVLKDPNPIYSSKLAEFLSNNPNYVKSKILISHIRNATEGKSYLKNTHPFERELFGKSWIFAHNGGVNKDCIINKDYKPIGETDSEKAFCYIMDRLKKNPDCEYDLKERIQIIESSAKYLSTLGRFNFLLSDSEYLYAFRSQYGNTLYYLLRRPPHNKLIILEDMDYTVKVNLSKVKDPDEVAAIVATTRLTNELKWRLIPKEQLMVFKDGSVVYPSRKLQNIEVYDSSITLGVIQKGNIYDVIGIPKICRDKLLVNVGDLVYVINPLNHKKELAEVHETDKRLISGEFKADNTEHAMITPRLRNKLGLKLIKTRDCNKFSKKFSSVHIIPYA